MMKKVFFLLSLFLIIGSCGKNRETTELIFKRSYAVSGDTFQSGMIVYAVNKNGLGVRGSEFFDGESDITPNSGLKSLPNGEWLFYAIASSSSKTTAQGGPLRDTSNSFYCGVANGGNSIELTGSGQTVEIEFSVANCSTKDIFAPSDFRFTSTNAPYDVSIWACTSTEYNAIDKTISGTSAPLSLCADNSVYDGKILVTAYVEYPTLSYLTVDPNTISYNVGNILATSMVGCKELTSASNDHFIDADGVALGNVDGDNFFISPFTMVIAILEGSCADLASATEVATAVVPRGLIDSDEGGIASSLNKDLAGFADDSTSTLNIFFNTEL